MFTPYEALCRECMVDRLSRGPEHPSKHKPFESDPDYFLSVGPVKGAVVGFSQGRPIPKHCETCKEFVPQEQRYRIQAGKRSSRPSAYTMFCLICMRREMEPIY